jgi:hypothetical protein
MQKIGTMPFETLVTEIIIRHVDSNTPDDEKEQAFVGEDWSFINLALMPNTFCAYVAEQLGLTILSISHSYGEQYSDSTLNRCYLSTCVFALNGVDPEKIQAFLDSDKEWSPYAHFDQNLLTVHLFPDETAGRGMARRIIPFPPAKS